VNVRDVVDGVMGVSATLYEPLVAATYGTAGTVNVVVAASAGVAERAAASRADTASAAA